MKHSINQTLFAYWNDVRQDRPAPRRFEIEPSQIAAILPNTFILERVDSETFRFRLGGTSLCEIFRKELRETNFIAAFDESDHSTVERLLTSVTLHCGVGTLDIETSTNDGRTATFEILLLPLVHTHGSIDRVLGSIAPKESPDWLGAEDLASWQLLASKVIWPDGRALPSMDSLQRQAPFMPHIRKARIVRSERRQFRVYDGGLTKSPSNET